MVWVMSCVYLGLWSFYACILVDGCRCALLRLCRPATAPPQRQLQWNGEVRHRAWAPPPGGRATLQEHLNIWGPKFGNQNVDNSRRYRSEFRRQYTGAQLPVPPRNAGKAPTKYVQPGFSPAMAKLRNRPQSAPVHKTGQPNYMKDTASRRNSKTAEDLPLPT